MRLRHRSLARAGSSDGTWLVVVAAGALAGVGLRLWVLTSPFGALDGDEALWGLMSRHALDGELSVFFWGQNYGGTQETLATALVFAAVGTGTLALRAVPILLFAAAAVLVWRVGRRTVGEPAARLAAVIFWVWPAYLVWKSTRAHGFYGAATVLGLCVLLFALRLRERDSWPDAAGLGLAVGLGWWATPQIAFVAAPALAWLVVRRGVSRTALAAVACFVLGAAPWLVWNMENRFDSLHAGFGPGEDSYLNHLKIFFATSLPYGLGVRVPFGFDWLLGAALGRACELLAVGSLLWLVVSRRPLGRVEPLVLVALAYPFLFAISPFSFLNDEPRYLVQLMPIMALLVSMPLARRVTTAFAGLAVAVGLAAATFAAIAEQRPAVPQVGGQRVPADLGPALAVLDGHRISRAFATYAIAYRITFETKERIVATPTGQTRYVPHRRRVVASPRPAYVFVAGSTDERRLASKLRQQRYSRVATGGWAVHLASPARTRHSPASAR